MHFHLMLVFEAIELDLNDWCKLPVSWGESHENMLRLHFTPK